jgi:RNA polymerase sigma-70 factor (family 1)
MESSVDVLHYNRLDDKELLRKLKKNDPQAFKEIYNRSWDVLLNHAYSVINDRDICLDILQDVYVWFWKNRELLEVESLQSYLKAAVKFQAINHIRKSNSREIYIKHFEHFSRSFNSTQNYIEIKELKEILDFNIEKLPPRCKEVFRLSRFEYKTNKEISVLLGISEKTVEMQITLAIKRLKAGLKEYMYLLVFLFQ